MSRYIVDASVGVKWFLPETHATAARRLLNGSHHLVVPDLFYPEIGNILWKKVRLGELTTDEANEIVSAILSLTIESHATQALLPAALEIAVRMGRIVYDSLNLSLAHRMDTALVTADERFYNSIATGPLARHVLWVENIPDSNGSP